LPRYLLVATKQEKNRHNNLSAHGMLNSSLLVVY